MVTHCAVLGSPIGHSLSPILHRAAYAELGLDWSYEAIEVTEAGLHGFVQGLDDSWRGLSLTMPLKRTVRPLLDEVDDAAARSRAANTVVLEAGRRLGANTDIPGAVAALREHGMERVGSVVVLGGGATAASVLLAVAELGCRAATLAVRAPARARETVDVVGSAVPEMALEVTTLDAIDPAADLLVSTIPASAQTPSLLARLRAPAVFEVRYDPWPTPLVDAAAAVSAVVVSGLDLLVHQAALQVELMTGSRAPLAAMRAAGEAALEGRSR
jgi:shikimate dehydrogenase